MLLGAGRGNGGGMARTHDGVSSDLGRSGTRIAVGAGLVAAGVGTTLAWTAWAGVPLVMIGLLGVLEGWTGNQRVRIATSKLVIEDTRPVRGFLIGPAKTRVPFDRLGALTVDGDAVKIERQAEPPLRVAAGLPAGELKELVTRVEDSVRRWKNGPKE